MLDFPEPYLLAPSALTPSALAERAEVLLLEVTPALLAALPVGGAVQLRGANFLYDAWLVRLGPEAASDLHAHERGYGAVAVVSGSLRETRAKPDGLFVRTLEDGDLFTTRPGDLHRLTVPQFSDAEDTVAIFLASPPRGHAPRIVTSSSATPVVPSAVP